MVNESKVIRKELVHPEPLPLLAGSGSFLLILWLTSQEYEINGLNTENDLADVCVIEPALIWIVTRS